MEHALAVRGREAYRQMSSKCTNAQPVRSNDGVLPCPFPAISVHVPILICFGASNVLAFYCFAVYNIVKRDMHMTSRLLG